MKRGMKFCFSVCIDKPVYTVPDASSINGACSRLENGIENVASSRTASRMFDAREKMAEPRRHMIVQKTSTAVA